MTNENAHFLASAPIAIASIATRLFRYPLTTPVVTSFGTMVDRAALLVEVGDRDGARGWGEIWCNFPACGPEHRARLVASLMAPLLVGRTFAGPAAATLHLTEATAVLALQSAEPGPFAQAIAGIDIALWDLAARRAGAPLWKVLGGSSASVAVYASGLNPDQPERLAERQKAAGHKAFKLKVGFGQTRDLDNLANLRRMLGDTARIMVDTNQGWDFATAVDMAPRLAAFDLDWLEEPLRADRPMAEWQALAAVAPMRLAAGENIATIPRFEHAIAEQRLGVIQPDVAKWGGFTGCLEVARRAKAAGLRFCPHYLGGGVGLLASAHLLAASGAEGLVEIDSNENPLRTLLCGPLGTIAEGRADLGNLPGLGAEPDLAPLARFEVRT